MADFPATWLDLREPVDAASRSRELARRLAAHLQPLDELRIADLGAGTGANLRWLAPQLPGRQHWHLLESDRALIRGMTPRLTGWASRRGVRSHRRTAGLGLGERLDVTWHAVDLARDPVPVQHLGGGPPHLVTASALADLVSRDWLARLAQACAQHGSAVLLALSYDGRVRLDPPHPLDARLRRAVNRHQLRDKGFGPALGPDAAAVAAALLRDHGFRVIQARSDWRLTADHRALVLDLLAGWRDAAADVPGAVTRASLDEWLAWRTRALDDASVGARVGHVDLLALPPR